MTAQHYGTSAEYCSCPLAIVTTSMAQAMSIKENENMGNNHQVESYSSFDTQGLVKAGLVTALYIVITMFVAPVAFGPIQFRISEGLNFMGLYNKRYIASITLGVMIVNAIQSTIVDVVVGSFHTLVSLLLARFIAKWAVKVFEKKVKDPMIIRYIVMTLVFTFTMFIIAAMLMYMGFADFFWETYAFLALSEFIVMTLGGLIMYYLIAPRIDFNK